MLTSRLHSVSKALCTGLPARAYSCCHWMDVSHVEDPETIWEVWNSRLKYGYGALREVGQDANTLLTEVADRSRQSKGKRVAVFTDQNQEDLPHLHTVVEGLQKEGLEVEVYADVEVEPTDISFKEATAFAIQGKFDAYVSVGGGSVMDTCKAANLYATFPPADNDFLTYVNPPIGKGTPPPGDLKPHIACPTTSGTGSENTGISVFDLLEMKAKTGIVHNKLRPSLAVLDPSVMDTLPSAVVAASGFDVLSHAMESYTARPFSTRPKPSTASKRPSSQGSNPWSDLGCISALEKGGKFIVRACTDPDDREAKEQLFFAAAMAGIAFGNAGCHLPHAMSYSVSGLCEDFELRDFPESHPMVPHGISVILNAPSVFRYTAGASPARHLRVAKALGAKSRDIHHIDHADIGPLLAEKIIELMRDSEYVPNGLEGVGYCEDDVTALTAGAFPQKRLVDNAPLPVDASDMKMLFKRAMSYW